jgi:hypothetical protein
LKRLIHLRELTLLIFLVFLFRRLLLFDPFPTLNRLTEIRNTVGREDGAGKLDVVVLLVGALGESSIRGRGVRRLEENLQISVDIKQDLPCDYRIPHEYPHPPHQGRAVPVLVEPREEVDLDRWDS